MGDLVRVLAWVGAARIAWSAYRGVVKLNKPFRRSDHERAVYAVEKIISRIFPVAASGLSADLEAKDRTLLGFISLAMMHLTVATYSRAASSLGATWSNVGSSLLVIAVTVYVVGAISLTRTERPFVSGTAVLVAALATTLAGVGKFKGGATNAAIARWTGTAGCGLVAVSYFGLGTHMSGSTSCFVTGVFFIIGAGLLSGQAYVLDRDYFWGPLGSALISIGGIVILLHQRRLGEGIVCGGAAMNSLRSVSRSVIERVRG